jgi:cystathionine beta-synthase
VITPTNVEAEDPRSYYSTAKRLVAETPNCFYANQYHNQDNPETHYLTTGPELWRQLAGEIDVFIAGMGTGGTISGIGRYLKEQNPKIQIVGVDPVGGPGVEQMTSDAFFTARRPKRGRIGAGNSIPSI